MEPAAKVTSMEQGASPFLFDLASVAEAESILADLATVFFQTSHGRVKRHWCCGLQWSGA